MCRSIPVMCLGLFISGCGAAASAGCAAGQIKRELPVICRLVSREQTVTISAGPMAVSIPSRILLEDAAQLCEPGGVAVAASRPRAST